MVLLAHGHAEHLGRYGHVVEALTGRGYVVAGHDHRGHGRSGGERALARRFDDYVDDWRLLAEAMREEYPDLPQVHVGHSMGGLVAVRYALRFGDDVRALITSGAAFIISDGVPGWQQAVLRLVSRVWPKAPIPRGDIDKLSHDPSVRAAFHADPFCYTGPARVRTVVEMAHAGADALARAGQLPMPLLGMHGASDTLTSPRGTEQFFARVASVDKELKLWPGVLHEILNGPSGEYVIAYMLDWLDRRAG